MNDFIIVGRGLAANVLMHAFYRAGLSFTTIGERFLSRSSLVAAGIWNPVVFKRMTASWKAQDLISALGEFYGYCERTMHTRFVTARQIVKPFIQEQEIDLWKKKAEAELEPFLVAEPQTNLAGLDGLNIPGSYGLVESSGNLDVSKFILASEQFFKDRIREERFVHADLQIEQDKVVFKEISASNIIFCEGHLITRNPFFKWLPMAPVKGEVITIYSEDIELKNRIFNRDGYLMDLEDHRYRLGSTFEWNDLSDKTSATGLKELEQKLRKMTPAQYVIEKQEAGVRPATRDRRPLVGRHPVHRHMFVFNGLGARGVMLAPYFAQKFVHFFLKNEDLCPEADVKRFYHLYERA